MRTRRALMSVGQAEPAESQFTFIAIPDTQQDNSSASGATSRFNTRMNWIVANRAALNIKFMVQNGDLVDWDDETHSHYVRADAGLDILDNANFPYALCIGNHDTAAVQYGGSAAPGNVNQNLRNSTTFNSYFPLSRFPNIQGVFEAGKVDNAYRYFTAGGLNFLVMNLEFCPRASVYPWADAVIKAHPNHNVIIFGHYILDSNGTVSGSNAGYGDTSAQQMYTAIVRDNPNVKFTFSGHVGTWAASTSTSSTTSHKTHHLLDCWHDSSNNPTRVCTFDVPARTVTTRIYYPNTGTYHASANHTFTNVDWVS
jgi:hypothetical protein